MQYYSGGQITGGFTKNRDCGVGLDLELEGMGNEDKDVTSDMRFWN